MGVLSEAQSGMLLVLLLNLSALMPWLELRAVITKIAMDLLVERQRL